MVEDVKARPISTNRHHYMAVLPDKPDKYTESGHNDVGDTYDMAIKNLNLQTDVHRNVCRNCQDE